MSPAARTDAYLALCERARALVAACAPVAEDDLLAHVYGARPPAQLRDHLVKPLLGDARLVRREDGSWVLAGSSTANPSVRLAELEFTALAIAANGPRPGQHRLVAIAAAHVAAGHVCQWFSSQLNPGRRLPRYVATRSRILADELDLQPTFPEIFDDLVSFLGERPIVMQEAERVWAYLRREARLAGCSLPACEVLDLNGLANALLGLPGKPTLAAIAQRCGINYAHVGYPNEEARVVGQVGVRLLSEAEALGLATQGDLCRKVGPPLAPGGSRPLCDAATPRALPDMPGIYVFRGDHEQALYVGKARRLRERLAAYTSRPLGATRRMEGLAEAVRAVEPRLCENELEALILEEREIRRLQPRYNTARRMHARPTWIRLPPESAPTRRKRRLTPPRLQLVNRPAKDGGLYLGPFRNGYLAESARNLARALFTLDESRRRDPADVYRERLLNAWRFLGGDAERGLAEARSQLSRAAAERDYSANRHWRGLLARARDYDPRQLLLPADPRQARYAIVRPHPEGVEGYVVDSGVLVAYDISDGSDPEAFARVLAEGSQPRTDPADVEVVLRWLGAQRDAGSKEGQSLARVLHLPDDPRAATGVILDAAARILAEQAARCAPTSQDEAALV